MGLTYASEITNPATGEIGPRRQWPGPDRIPGWAGPLPRAMKPENSTPFNINVTLGEASRRSAIRGICRQADDLNVVFIQLQSDTPLNLPHVEFALLPASSSPTRSPYSGLAIP